MQHRFEKVLGIGLFGFRHGWFLMCIYSGKHDSEPGLVHAVDDPDAFGVAIRDEDANGEGIGSYVLLVSIHSSANPLGSQQLRLLQHRLSGLFLLIRRIAVLPQYPLHDHPQLGSDAFFHGPVDGDIALNRLD